MEGMSLDGPEALARHVAEWMVERLGATEGIVAVALSGGSTPKLLYSLLATDEFSGRIPWDRVHWCWGDERFVPPDDPSSNYRMTNEAMFKHVPVAAEMVHPIVTTGLSPAAAAAAYEQTLRAIHGGGIWGGRCSRSCCWGWARMGISRRCSRTRRR